MTILSEHSPDLSCFAPSLPEPDWAYVPGQGEEECLSAPDEAGAPQVVSHFSGRSALVLQPGQYLRVPRRNLGALDIHGADACVSVVAWIWPDSRRPWQAIAGVWDETRRKRQYCLFYNAASATDSRTGQRAPTTGRIHGHISSGGGPTDGQKCCVTYASGGSQIPLDRWSCIAMTYDGDSVRLYRDGVLDEWQFRNPFALGGGIFDGGSDGADFTIGSNSVGGKMINHYSGLIGGVSVYRRALSADEMCALAL